MEDVGKSEEEIINVYPETYIIFRKKRLGTCSLKIICVEIKKPYNKPFLVCAWYRPPSTNMSLFVIILKLFSINVTLLIRSF